MSYTPLTDQDRREMLKEIGISSLDRLFANVPQDYRYPVVDLPPPLSEMQVLDELTALSARNQDLSHNASFLGAGAYQHYVPAVVKHIISRSEFYTAYTPYQPEISQGTLQATFEYQSMICALTGMQVSNASHYDGATALAEAVLMGYNVSRGKRHKALLAADIHPEYRSVTRTYVQGMDIECVDIEASVHDLQALTREIDDDTFCVVVQNPGFYGEIGDPEALQQLAGAVHDKKALFVVVSYPIALGLLKPPGEYGADIVVGEAQSLGVGLNFGGPYIGYFSCLKKYVHKMAGRLVGQTVDVDGQRGFVLTLAAREQHIRRERATSNICTNQALCALAVAVYLSTMGPSGLRQIAELCYHKAHYLADRINALEGYDLVTRVPFFNEFVVRCPRPIGELNAELAKHQILGGFDLGCIDAAWADRMLVCTTEIHSREMLDAFVATLEAVR